MEPFIFGQFASNQLYKVEFVRAAPPQYLPHMALVVERGRRILYFSAFNVQGPMIARIRVYRSTKFAYNLYTRRKFFQRM